MASPIRTEHLNVADGAIPQGPAWDPDATAECIRSLRALLADAPAPTEVIERPDLQDPTP